MNAHGTHISTDEDTSAISKNIKTRMPNYLDFLYLLLLKILHGLVFTGWRIVSTQLDDLADHIKVSEAVF